MNCSQGGIKLNALSPFISEWDSDGSKNFLNGKLMLKDDISYLFLCWQTCQIDLFWWKNWVKVKKRCYKCPVFFLKKTYNKYFWKDYNVIRDNRDHHLSMATMEEQISEYQCPLLLICDCWSEDLSRDQKWINQWWPWSSSFSKFAKHDEREDRIAPYGKIETG